MSLSSWCFLIGVGLTVVGGALGLRGFLGTFRTYSPDGRLRGSTKERLKAAWAWLHRLLRSTAEATDSGTFTENASVHPSLPHVGTARLPSKVVKDLQDQVAGLDYQRALNISALDQEIRRVALDGIRLQAVGLLLTIAGALFMGVPTLASTDPQERIACQGAGHGELRCTTR